MPQGLKEGQGKMLDELCALTGWSRDHARRALREAVRPPKRTPKRVPTRTQTYGSDLGQTFSQDLGDARWACRRPRSTVGWRRSAVSCASRGKAWTKPGGAAQAPSPDRIFAEWDGARRGFIECDLVAHEGGNAKGDYCQTLDLTDIATG